MKKRMTIIFMILFTVCCLWAETNWYPYEIIGPEVFSYRDEDVAIRFCPTEVEHYHESEWDGTSYGVIDVFSGKVKVVDGYCYLEETLGTKKPHALLLGKNIVIYTENDHENFERYKDWPAVRKELDYEVVSNSGDEEWNISTYFVTHDAGIKKITSSSSLLETIGGKVQSYLPENLLGKIFLKHHGDVRQYFFYDSTINPWVEAVEGDGIGEYLDIEFKKFSDELQILNGFVDFRRKHLFKDNNRVKTILVESSEPKFSQEYELEDAAKYTSIKLPAKTNRVKITIKEVYPGNKWQDTCLSSILVTDPDLPPYPQQKDRILQFMKEYGLWNIMQKYKQ